MVRRRRLLAAVVLVAVAALWSPVGRWWRAGELLMALSSQHGPTDAAGAPAALSETDVSIAGRDGPIRARVYRRADADRDPGLVVVHGVHWQGIDERRLVPFARELARSGRVVVTPELAELADYRITDRGVETISDTVRWLSDRRDLVTEPQVGLLGFSFAGGLSLVAATRDELRGRLAYVTSVGGHHDLARVLRFLVTDTIETPSGPVHERAHEYGLVVVVYGHIDRFVDEPDRAVMRDALREWLHGDRAAAAALAARRTTAGAERLFQLLEQGRLHDIGPSLAALVGESAPELAGLSPAGRLSRVSVPVFLLHGSGDSVIPPSEAEWADRELAGAPHRALVSPLLEHVEVSKTAALGHQLALVDFMAQLL